MKKFALAAITTAFIALGHTPVNAQQLPSECEGGEFDGTEEECIDFYTEILPPTTPAPTTTTTTEPTPTTTEVVGNNPPVTTTTTTTTTTLAQTAGPLPRTGSGVSPILGVGTLLLVGGGIIVVATRRRSTASAS